MQGTRMAPTEDDRMGAADYLESASEVYDGPRNSDNPRDKLQEDHGRSAFTCAMLADVPL